MLNTEFELEVVGIQKWDVLDDNVDVEVRFPDGRRYTATFFTLKNLESLFKKNRETGECLNGMYLWAIEMIIVENLERSTMTSTVKNLLQEDEFESAFTRVSDVGIIDS